MEQDNLEKSDVEKNDAEKNSVEKNNIRIDNDPDKKVNISNIQNQVKKNPWMISTIVLGIIALILLVMVFRGGGITGNVVSADIAGERLIEFGEAQGVDLEILDISDVGDFYDVLISVQGQESNVQLTKDGENMVQLIPLAAANTPQQQPEPAEVPKSDKPVVELYVFTYCPYGTQSEKGILPVVELLGDKIDFKIRQIGAMHGEYEKIEAIRQLCIEKQAPTKFLDYVYEFALDGAIGVCSNDMECSEPLVDALYTKLGINKAEIDSCMASDGDLLYAAEEEYSRSKGVSGSPNLIINGENAQSGRDSASYLATICSAFNTAPEECEEVLSSASPSPGFGGSTTASANANAQC